MKRLTFITSALAFALTASTTFAVEETSWGTLKQQLTNAPAAKRTKDATFSTSTETVTADAPTEGVANNNTQSQWVYPDAPAKFSIELGVEEGPTLSAGFTVTPGAVAEPVFITMSATGSTLSDLVIVFEPGGLEFLEAQSLEIVVSKELVDIDLSQLKVYHRYSDGTVEETPLYAVSSIGGGKMVQIRAAVSSFSRYGLRSNAW